MSKQTSVYRLSEEVEHFKDKHLTPYVEKRGKGGLKMDLNLRPPSVSSVTLTFSATTIINNASNYIGRNIKAYKSLSTCQYFVSIWVTTPVTGTVVTGSGIYLIFVTFDVDTSLCIIPYTVSEVHLRLMVVILR